MPPSWRPQQEAIEGCCCCCCWFSTHRDTLCFNSRTLLPPPVCRSYLVWRRPGPLFSLGTRARRPSAGRGRRRRPPRRAGRGGGPRRRPDPSAPSAAPLPPRGSSCLPPGRRGASYTVRYVRPHGNHEGGRSDTHSDVHTQSSRARTQHHRNEHDAEHLHFPGDGRRSSGRRRTSSVVAVQRLFLL